jgi:Cell division protein FtsI/penicillin-binding protein 2
MALKVKVKPDVEYTPIPEGTYTAICYTIADCGLQYSEKFKKSSHKILFIWELVDDDLRIEIDGKMKRRTISKQYTASFATKSNMYKDLRPWLGREFTQEEAEGTFDITSFISKSCLLNIINEANTDGKIYSSVASVMQLPKGIKTEQPENPIVLYDIDESSDEELKKLPEWVQERIKKAVAISPESANTADVIIDPKTGEVLAETSAPSKSVKNSISDFLP